MAGADEVLRAAIERDDALEDAGMHADDRQTCWTHQSWSKDCADDPMHTNPTSYVLTPLYPLLRRGN
jgi:hypothetical protein